MGLVVYLFSCIVLLSFLIVGISLLLYIYYYYFFKILMVVTHFYNFFFGGENSFLQPEILIYHPKIYKYICLK